MINQVPKKITGFRADVINSIIDYLMSITPLDGHQIRYDRTTYGTLPIFRGLDRSGTKQYRRLFELYDMKEDSVKVFIIPFTCGFFWQGQMLNLSEPLGRIMIKSDSYIYVRLELFDYHPAQATVEITNDVDDLNGTDNVENYPLWFIPFKDDKIVTEGIVDLRDAIHATGFSG